MSINIKPSHKGKFTAWAKAHGMSVSQAASTVMANTGKYPASVVKMANFAKNEKGFKHSGRKSGIKAAGKMMKKSAGVTAQKGN